jgi:hypothetical protein
LIGEVGPARSGEPGRWRDERIASDDRPDQAIRESRSTDTDRVAFMARPTGYAAAVVLAGIAGLHVAWGRGSSFPFENRSALADAVVGAPDVPPPAACHAVAVALAVASGLAADLPVGSPWLRRAGRMGVAVVLAVRGLVGIVGRTDLMSPGSSLPRFRRLDRRVYAPLCLLLSACIATAVPRR